MARIIIVLSVINIFINNTCQPISIFFSRSNSGLEKDKEQKTPFSFSSFLEALRKCRQNECIQLNSYL